MYLSPEDLLRLLLAFVIGAVVGLEREYRSKSAGLRTMILISLGSTLFTLLSIKVSLDAGRIAANVITGIGFIGGGIIFREHNQVVGLTTAAAVWVTAAMGMAIGAGYYEMAFFTFALVILSLIALIPLQSFMKTRNQIRNYRIVTKYQQKTLKRYEELFREYKLDVMRGKQNRTGDRISGNWTLQGSEKQHEKLTKYLLNDSDVVEFDF
ncbi:MgtC/SapB family protein [Telluribacter sp. SYSU D00476]|uniref:MgtC/SapB family protein n=1 Tax=Telluribacter sp. SYSU D00476 TaxID=2811430 RepID=UPI001FF2B150|nr:MgtC/SapB family protein [Telluribacter sp. SYSU D00476]